MSNWTPPTALCELEAGSHCAWAMRCTVLFGTPDTIAKRIRRYEAAEASYFCNSESRSR